MELNFTKGSAHAGEGMKKQEHCEFESSTEETTDFSCAQSKMTNPSEVNNCIVFRNGAPSEGR